MIGTIFGILPILFKYSWNSHERSFFQTCVILETLLWLLPNLLFFTMLSGAGSIFTFNMLKKQVPPFTLSTQHDVIKKWADNFFLFGFLFLIIIYFITVGIFWFRMSPWKQMSRKYPDRRRILYQCRRMFIGSYILWFGSYVCSFLLVILISEYFEEHLTTP